MAGRENSIPPSSFPLQPETAICPIDPDEIDNFAALEIGPLDQF